MDLDTGGKSLAITSDGRMFYWGPSDNGAATLTEIFTEFGPWKEVKSGETHFCVIAQNNKVLCWGENDAGQLGNGTIESSDTPTPIALDREWKHLSINGLHSCAIDTDDDVYCWGLDITQYHGYPLERVIITEPTKIDLPE